MAAITFLDPAWLWLALAVPVLWFVPRRLRDLPQGALRAAALLFLVAAIAQPVSIEPARQVWRVVVLDAGGSVASEADGGLLVVPQRAETAVAAAVALGTAGRADGPTVLVRTADSLAVPKLEAVFDRVVTVTDPRSTSPLGALLAAASRAIPHGARGSVTIFSDGLSTDRRWGPAVQDLQARGIPVHVAPLSTHRDGPTLGTIRVPEVVRVGHTALLDVQVVTAVDADAVLVDTDGGVLGRAAYRSGGAWRVTIPFEPTEAGILEAEVRLVRPDAAFRPTPGNHRAIRLAVQPPLRVAYLGERMDEGGPRLADLVGPGFELVPAAGPLADVIASSDLFVIDDASADRMGEDAQRELLQAVAADRIGLVMAGGRGAFGAGGWHDQPLAEALPIEMIQKEEKRDPSTTLVVIIDTSGSMGGNRVQLAKEVARLAIRRLLPHDKVGIVEFYGAKRWAAPIQPASNAIEIQRALNRLNAGGGTVIMPAIEEAFYGLQNVRTRYKHVLVLTDGGVEQGAFEPLLRRMADKGITVSTVLVGPGMHSEFLVNLANWGKGRFYGVPNRFNLPEIILKQPASAQLPSWRPGNHAVAARGPAGWWAAVDRAAIPPLSGYVEARAKPGAQVLLEVAATKHPVLATWRHGLGRATALLTEPTGPGTTDWRDWPEYGTWLGRVLARTAAERRVPYVAKAVRGEAGVRLTLHGASTVSPPVVRVRATTEGAWEPLTLRPRAPGLFMAHVPAADAFQMGPAERPTTWVVPQDDVVPEHQVDPEGALALARLAEVTGGDVLVLGPRQVFAPRAGGGDAPLGVDPLARWCFLLALLCFLMEIAWRRRPSGGTA